MVRASAGKGDVAFGLFWQAACCHRRCEKQLSAGAAETMPDDGLYHYSYRRHAGAKAVLQSTCVAHFVRATVACCCALQPKTNDAFARRWGTLSRSLPSRNDWAASAWWCGALSANAGGDSWTCFAFARAF